MIYKKKEPYLLPTNEGNFMELYEMRDIQLENGNIIMILLNELLRHSDE